MLRSSHKAAHLRKATPRPSTSPYPPWPCRTPSAP